MTSFAIAPMGEPHPPMMCFSLGGLDISVTLETITPLEAELILRQNTHNRREKRDQQTQYAADMAAGAWRFNGATMCIAADGTLLDGQNRLKAIIASGVALPCLIVRGLAVADQDDMDTHSKRKFADVLTIAGEKDAANLAALVRRVLTWEEGQRRWLLKKTVQSNTTLKAGLAAHPELRNYVTPARRLADELKVNRANMGLLMYAFDKLDEEEGTDDAGPFFDRLLTGAGLEEDDPIRTLREALHHDEQNTGEAQMMKHLAWIIKAWNAYRRGEQMSVMSWRAGGARPERFPEPI